MELEGDMWGKVEDGERIEEKDDRE